MGFKNSISLGPVISTANHLLRVCLGVISLPFEKQSQLLCHSFLAWHLVDVYLFQLVITIPRQKRSIGQSVTLSQR